jgi:ATP-dependent exoDNAse (exonuclease V) alpha subunit
MLHVPISWVYGRTRRRGKEWILIESGVVPVVRLTEVFRQAASSKIITSTHLIRQGKMPELRTAEAGSHFYFVERETPEEIAACG